MGKNPHVFNLINPIYLIYKLKLMKFNTNKQELNDWGWTLLSISVVSILLLNILTLLELF
jgi:hypothetical protein